MENNFEFWEDYLTKIKNKMCSICKEKEAIFIDLHIHSNYSADGKQTLKEIIKSTKKFGFDVISITDHDSIKVYDELFEIVKNGLTYPLIIPGVELTIDNSEYGNQCHILQLFINPKESNLMNNVIKNYNAMFKRSEIQFERLSENKAVQELISKNNIDLSYHEYIEYLNENHLVPEYDTLGSYLMNKFKEKNINTFEILNRLEHYNLFETNLDKKKYKEIRFNKLKNKYLKTKNNYFDSHLLMSMLAIKEIDDDWWDSPSCGSLSVNSYGQLKINEINNKYMTVWAHPTENKLCVVEKCIKKSKNIIGLEQNIRNRYENINNFNDLLEKNNLFRIFGSDSHDNSGEFYRDMLYYKIDSLYFMKNVLGVTNEKN